MYTPEYYAEDEPHRMLDLIAGHGFGLVVTCDAEGSPFASHLPLLHDPAPDPRGKIVGHMARANPQWRQFDPERDVLAVFSGPHAYVSPSWYETHPSVPTWNYAAVHVYGRPRIIEDPEGILASVRRLVDRYESDFETPWRMNLPQAYETSRLRAIVAFEIEISRLEGKFKLNQKSDEVDRRNVADRLDEQGFDNAKGVAELMRQREDPPRRR
jgi:transcriptional regulator